MKIVPLVLIIALTVGAIAQELNTILPSERTAQSVRAEEKTGRSENSGTCDDNLSWIFNDETYTLTISGQGVMSCCNETYTPWSQLSNQVQIIVIQEGVSSVGQYAFKDFSILKTVSITPNITSIGTSAFYNCKNLTSITIPSSVTSIGEWAFFGCESLSSITIPSGVTLINNYTFYGCLSLKTVNFTSNITSIGSSAFEGCTNLASITIPSSVTSIGRGAFSGCSSLTSINIPSSVNSINDNTFYGCISLKSVNITSNLTSIGSSAFFNCKNLTSISIPSSVKSIGSYAFNGCESLTSITIPSRVISIYDYTFNGCVSLKSVNITSSITSIGYSAFNNCKNLTSIIIPSSVKTIGSTAFLGCSSLTSVIYLGSKDPIRVNTKDIFTGCDQLKFVCVSSSYNSNSFCGLNQFCKHKTCESFLHNQCYENPVCNFRNNTISMEKREKATIWESKSTGCYEFQCDFNHGPIYWKQCNKTDEVCEDDECVVVSENVTHYVEIEIDGINMTDLNMTEIQTTISDLTGIETDDIIIHVDTNENNEVIRIIVLVDDEDSAIIVSDKINQCSHQQEIVSSTSI